MDVQPDVMLKLRERYRSSLPDKKQQLEKLRDRLRGGEACGPEIRALAHRFAGSGASYGWPEITDAASPVELADDEALPSALDALIAVFDAAAARAPG